MARKIVPLAHSVLFHIDEPIGPMEVMRLLERKVDPRNILTLNYHIGGFYVCTLSSEEDLQYLLSEGLEFKDKRIAVESIMTNIVGFSIKNLPHVISNDAVSNSIKHYGRALCMDRDKSNNQNVGNRQVIIELVRDLPKTIRVGGGNYEIIS